MLAIAGTVLVAAGLVSWGRAYDGPEAETGRASEAAVNTSPVTVSPAAPPAVPASWKPGAPREIRLPALGVMAPVDPVGLVGETLVPPADPDRVGWWADGARPGGTAGSVLLAGHTVRGGEGALQRIGELDTGDTVIVRTEAGELRYRIASVRTFGKGELAARAQQLFAQQGPARLVLLTCSDWDGSQYLSNVVATAVPDG